ncbi:MAG: xanthine dehydrogenase family protein subunit M [Clostridiales bacterium]|nr:xanthine dehydrogenase family protein subunit M [Clostridiales bacterium]
MSSIHLKGFEYFEPETVQEAVDLLDEYGPDAQILAGGVDLIPRLRSGSQSASCLISIGRIAGISETRFDREAGYAFGAMTTLKKLDGDPDLKSHFPCLQEAIHQITSVQSKAMGTAVGNLCVATPASDVSPALMAYDAELSVFGPSGERTVKVSDFYEGYHKTVLGKGEFVTGVSIKTPAEGTGAAFLNKVRTHADIAKVTVAAVVVLEGGVCKEARIGLGAAAPVAFRPAGAEAVLVGKAPDEAVIAEAAEAAAEEASPITDFRSTEEYRLEMARVLTRRALSKAFENAGRAV